MNNMKDFLNIFEKFVFNAQYFVNTYIVKTRWLVLLFFYEK